MHRFLFTSIVITMMICVIAVGDAAVAHAQSTPDPAEIQTAMGVAFGEANGEPLLLDVFQPPARDKPRPAVILIFGSAWSFGDRSGMSEPARRLAEAGYVAFSIDHRLLNAGGDNPWPAQLDDAQRAVRWVRAHAAEYGVDPDRLCSYGWSSGATLAALLGVRETRDNSDPDLADFSSRVNCVVALSGDLDMTVPQTDYGFELILENLLGGTAEEQPEAYRDVSALTWVDAEAPPFLIIHGGLDDTILAEQSRQMATALFDAGVEVAYVVIPEFGHDGSNYWLRNGPLILGFLEMHMHPAV
jgi:acetyl esterase/lipase